VIAVLADDAFQTSALACDGVTGAAYSELRIAAATLATYH